MLRALAFCTVVLLSAVSSNAETAKVTIRGVLDSSANSVRAPFIGTPCNFGSTHSELIKEASFTTNVVVIDAQKREHQVSVYFYRTSKQTYEARLYVLATEMQTLCEPLADALQVVLTRGGSATILIRRSSETGRRKSSVKSFLFNFDSNAAAQKIKFDFRGMKIRNASSAVDSILLQDAP
jgi:hypothetical protein